MKRPLAGILLVVGMLSSSGFADSNNGSANASGGISEMIQIGSDQVTGVHSLMSRSEAAGVSEFETSSAAHWVVGDLNLLTQLGLGQSYNSDGLVANVFQLRFQGSISGGLQAYKVVPLTLSAEDLTYVTSTVGTRSSSLLGSTIYLPIRMGQDAENPNSKSVLLLAVTVGARYNSQIASSPEFAIQAKAHFVSEKFSFEARYLFAVGSDSAEKKWAAQANYFGVAGTRDSLGVAVSQDWFQMQGQEMTSGPEVTLLYGLGF